MKRTILALTLTLLLSPAARAVATGSDPANAQIPTATTRSMVEAESSAVKIYIEDTPAWL